MYLTSKNLFVVVYCCIFAPLKRILLRGESPQTIISSKKMPVWLVPPDNLFFSLKKKKRRVAPDNLLLAKKRLYGFVPSENYFLTPLLAQACSLCREKNRPYGRRLTSENLFLAKKIARAGSGSLLTIYF